MRSDAPRSKTPGLPGLACAALLALLAACAVIRVNTDFDPEFDFGATRSFAVSDAGRSAPKYPETREQAQVSIVRSLEAKGYVRADPSEADLLFTYDGGSDIAARYTTHPVYTEHWGGTQVWTNYHTEGHLVIECVDRRSGRVVWHGSARETLYEDMNRVAETKQAVGKILDRFPDRPR